MDVPRSLLAGLAAAVASIGAIAANADDGMALGIVAAWVFAGEAVIGGALAVVPSGGRWSPGRRGVAAIVAVGSTVLAPLLIFVTMSRAACGCGDPATGYMLPTVLGIVAHDWVVITAIAVPVLLGATTAPALDRLWRGRGA